MRGKMKATTMETMESNNNKASNKRTCFLIILSVLAIALACIVLYKSTNPFLFISIATSSSSFSLNSTSNGSSNKNVLERVLERASMEDKTVILTTLNDAWAEPNSIFDLFLESFQIENQTKNLLNHLVVLALDEKAYARCVKIHPHCYPVDTHGKNYTSEAYFMTPDYLEMMWRRISLLTSVLRLRYNFVFTDADIMWLRDPFPHFIPDADFQIACDFYKGNSLDRKNNPNGGFTYVKSNNRTIRFYEFWYKSRINYPGKHDQDVLNEIKFDPYITNNIRVQLRFLDTNYFSGFCEPSKDFNLVCTMHANCCFGLESKVDDLKLVLQDWRKYVNAPTKRSSWSVPNKCRTSYHPPNIVKKDINH